jgi:hypothetical protein
MTTPEPPRDLEAERAEFDRLSPRKQADRLRVMADDLRARGWWFPRLFAWLFLRGWIR